MQTPKFRRALRVCVLPLVLAFAACSTSDDPYSRIPNGPLATATLHAVTFATDGPALVEQLQKDGYTLLPLAPNYQAAIRVQSIQWQVTEEVAGKVAVLKGPPGELDVRVLAGALPAMAAAEAPPEPVVMRAFYKNVLGADVPRLPDKINQAPNVRVQVWTFFITDILGVRRKLREHMIPVLTEPVHITTTYLGDEQSLTLRAPDGAIVELVQTVTQ
jgi:hypothetical protein